MAKNFRKYHLFKVLEGLDLEKTPLDVHLNNYYRNNRALGSKDRKFLSETIYTIVRWKGLIDHYCTSSNSWEDRLETLESLNLKNRIKDEKLPSYIRASFPKELFDLIKNHYGEKQALEICLACNTSAPTTIRANILKTTRRDLIKKWGDKFSITQTKQSVWGINFKDRTNFQLLEEFKKGHFEIQDEASQLVANLVEAKPGEKVLDYCAGAGGKSLAFAHKLQLKGEIYLHDIRPKILEKGERRIKRAGVENAHILPYDSEEKKNLLGQMDWVLVDVPCSGTGTLRRNPDLKWKFTPEQLNALVVKQREIFAEALTFLKPDGKIVYATCSLLVEENEHQVAYFQKTHCLDLVSKPFQSLPSEDGMDGFFGATLKNLQSC